MLKIRQSEERKIGRIEEYVHEQEHKRRRALGLDGLIEAAQRDAGPAAAGEGARS